MCVVIGIAKLVLVVFVPLHTHIARHGKGKTIAGKASRLTFYRRLEICAQRFVVVVIVDCTGNALSRYELTDWTVGLRGKARMGIWVWICDSDRAGKGLF